MRADQRIVYWLQWERRRNGVEKRWKSKINAGLDAQVQSVVHHLKDHSVLETKLTIDHLVGFERIGKLIQALYIQAGLYQANVLYREIRTFHVKYTGMGFNEQWTRDIQDYFERNLLNKAVLPITETTKRIIRKILDQAIAEGWSTEQTVRAIMDEGTTLNKMRAKLITRTESVRAMNVGSIIAANESNLLLDKVWITAKDERVRRSHRRLEGVKLAMDDVFANGLSFPGDPAGTAKDVCNCRCTLAFVPRRDAEGRPIRKPRARVIAHDRRDTFSQVAEGIAAGITIGSALEQLLNE